MVIYTTREVAEQLQSDEWRVRRLFEDGTLSEVARFGNKRVIAESLIPQIRQHLEERGWVPRTEEETCD